MVRELSNPVVSLEPEALCGTMVLTLIISWRGVSTVVLTLVISIFSGEECRRRSSSMIFYLSTSGEECRRCCELNGFLSFFFGRGVSTAVELNSGWFEGCLVESYVSQGLFYTELWDSRGVASRGGVSPQVKTFSFYKSRYGLPLLEHEDWGIRGVAVCGGVSPPARTEVE